MPRQAEPGRNDRGQGVYGVRTGTAWDSLWSPIARFTNSVADYTRDELHLLIGVSHDTDLSKKKRRIFTAAGGTITHGKHQRGNPTYTFGGVEVGKKRAFKIVQQIKRGRIPSTPPAVVPPVKPPAVGTPSPDSFRSPYADFGLAANYGPRRRFKRKKKKSKLRSAAGVLAAAATRGLQTGDEVFSELLARGRSVVRQVAPEFQRLLNRGPMSDFERLLHDKPYRALPDAAPAARAVVSGAARAAGSIALLLWPSSIGQEPPWAPPKRPTPMRTRAGRRPRRVPLPKAPGARPVFAPGSTTPRPRPQTGNRPFPLPTSNPQRWPDSQPSPVLAPAPVASRGPSPSPTRPATPGAAPRTSLPASWSLIVSPFAVPTAARRTMPRLRPRVVAWPQQDPLTRTKTAPAESGCDCQKATRTRRERKKRCSNPVIKRSRTSSTITITRRIKCPA